jgi:hypothetical protein
MRNQRTASTVPTITAVTLAILLLGFGGLWRLTKTKGE